MDLTLACTIYVAASLGVSTSDYHYWLDRMRQRAECVFVKRREVGESGCGGGGEMGESGDGVDRLLRLHAHVSPFFISSIGYLSLIICFRPPLLE